MESGNGLYWMRALVMSALVFGLAGAWIGSGSLFAQTTQPMKSASGWPKIGSATANVPRWMKRSSGSGVFRTMTTAPLW